MATTTRHRRAYTQQQRSQHLAHFERSGLSPAEFCRRAKIHLSTFSLWRHGTKAASAPAFAQVRLTGSDPIAGAMLHLPGGAKLEVTVGTDAAWVGLGRLLKSLQS